VHDWPHRRPVLDMLFCFTVQGSICSHARNNMPYKDAGSQTMATIVHGTLQVNALELMSPLYIPVEVDRTSEVSCPEKLIPEFYNSVDVPIFREARLECT